MAMLCVYLIYLWNYLVSDNEVPPPSKRMRTMEDEGVEQLQPTLDSEETTTAGEGVLEDVL